MAENLGRIATFVPSPEAQTLLADYKDVGPPPRGTPLGFDDGGVTTLIYGFEVVDPESSIDATTLIDAYLIARFGTGAETSVVRELDLGRGHQYAAPMYMGTVLLMYPPIAGSKQPPIRVSIAVGRYASHGVGMSNSATRTLLSTDAGGAGGMIAIPAGARNAILVSPTLGQTATFNQYASSAPGSLVISSSIIGQSENSAQPIAHGALYYELVNAGSNARVQFGIV